MKSLIIAFLLLVIGVLLLDEKTIRSELADARKQLLDPQAQPAGQVEQFTPLQNQANQAGVGGPQVPSPLNQTQPAQNPEQTASGIVTDYSDALAIIEGSKGAGSGFICKMDGRTYVITNAHVLCDNPGLRITSIKGTGYSIGSSAVAVAHDIVKMEVTGAQKAFDVMTNIDSNVKIGDAVTILGNSEGAGVVRPVDGKIVGIGPDLIEVDAPFVKGNSGSPIIHQLTGKVLGVATYITTRRVDAAGAQGSVLSDVRRFGYRLDDVKQWQQINWQGFYSQSAQVASMETLSLDFITMFKAGGLNLNVNDYSSPAMQRTVRRFLQSVSDASRTMSATDKQMLVHNFLGELRSVTHADILAFNRYTAYDYFLREVDDQSRFREELYDGLTRSLENAR